MRFFFHHLKMNIKTLYSYYLQNPIICSDSRNIIPGSIYFALKGSNFDGNQFAAEALNKGSSFAVIDNPYFRTSDKFIVVKNSLKTLQTLANYHRKMLGIPIVAITGTNGKTTTKELTAAVLSKKYNVTSTQGNLNNHIGVPLTLLSMNKNTEIGIVEMGANHVGEIKALCKIAEPNTGIITNIGKAHLEGFGSVEGVIKAKTELYKYLVKNNGVIIFNSDNTLLKKIISKYSILCLDYGTIEKCYLTGRFISADPFLELEILNNHSKETQSRNIVKTQFIGAYNFENAMASACIGKYFNVPIENCIDAITNYSPENNRSQRVKIGNNILLLDYYNANPTSMEMAIINFYNTAQNNKKKIMFIGEMLELGIESENEHTNIVNLIESFSFSEVHYVGKGFQHLKKNISNYYTSIEELKEKLITSKKIENAFIFIKGSRGVHMEKILDCFQE
jgi:UDP-N-acetylmuramoyl-tripeptide--D-alanyl-D-alanine ligase